MLRTLVLILSAAALATAADNPWDKVKALKSGTDIRIIRIASPTPIEAKFDEATDDRAVNHRISELAKRRRIPANIADSAAECDFVVPARLQRGDTQIAISTSGRSPRLSAALRQKLDTLLP